MLYQFYCVLLYLFSLYLKLVSPPPPFFFPCPLILVVGVRQLDDSRDNFERGRTDVFRLESFDIGEVDRIRIGHDNAGVGAAWYLKDVRIEEEETKKSWKFLCNRWLAKDEGDGATEAEFTLESKGGLEGIFLVSFLFVFSQVFRFSLIIFIVRFLNIQF